jgi:23S rRNA-/tRNA-specific pseudouridylate synthase
VRLRKGRRKGLVLLGDEIGSTSTKVTRGHTVHVLTRARGGAVLDVAQAPMQLAVAFEDDHFGAVVKPQGIPTMQMGLHTATPSAAECIKFVLSMPRIPGAHDLHLRMARSGGGSKFGKAEGSRFSSLA